jgi:O-antigen/teichoic acid export membrane protein
MRRFCARNLLFVILVNVLVKPAWIFLIDRTVQNKVGHEAYGTYQPLLNLAIIFQILLDFGINNYNSRSLSHHPGKVKQLFPVMMSARLLLSGAYMIIVSGIGLLLNYSYSEMLLLLGLLSVQVMGSVIQFYRSTAAGLHKFKWDGLLSVSDRLLMILICGTLLMIPSISAHFKIEWYVLALMASYGLAMIGGFAIIRHIAGVGLSMSFQRARVTNIMRRSLPYAVLILLMSVYTRVDFVLLERLGGSTGKEHAGIYATAYRLLDVGNMFGLLFANMLLPILGRMLRQKENVASIIRLSTNVLLPLSLLVAVTGMLYPREIMDLLYRDTTSDNATVFTLLMLAFPAFSLSNVYSTLLTAAGKLRTLIVIAAVGVVVNVVLNVVLIQQILSPGAALAALATQWLTAICFVLAARRTGGLEIKLLWGLSFVGYFLLMMGIGYGLNQLPLDWMLRCSVLIVSGVLLLFVFRYIRVKELMRLAGGA